MAGMSTTDHQPAPRPESPWSYQAKKLINRRLGLKQRERRWTLVTSSGAEVISLTSFGAKRIRSNTNHWRHQPCRRALDPNRTDQQSRFRVYIDLTLLDHTQGLQSEIRQSPCRSFQLTFSRCFDMQLPEVRRLTLRALLRFFHGSSFFDYWPHFLSRIPVRRFSCCLPSQTSTTMPSCAWIDSASFPKVHRRFAASVSLGLTFFHVLFNNSPPFPFYLFHLQSSQLTAAFFFLYAPCCFNYSTRELSCLFKSYEGYFRYCSSCCRCCCCTNYEQVSLNVKQRCRNACLNKYPACSSSVEQPQQSLTLTFSTML